VCRDGATVGRRKRAHSARVIGWRWRRKTPAAAENSAASKFAAGHGQCVGAAVVVVERRVGDVVGIIVVFVEVVI